MATVGTVTRVNNGKKPYMAWLEIPNEPLKALGQFGQPGDAKKAIENAKNQRLRWIEVALPGNVVQFVGDDGT